MTTTVRHLPNSIIESQHTSIFKLTHNRPRTQSNLSGVPNSALPYSSFWYGIFTDPLTTRETQYDPYDDTIAGWSNLEGLLEEYEELDLYFTARDPAHPFPLGHPVPDLEYGICTDYPTQEDFDKLQGTMAAVAKLGRRGDPFVTIKNLNPIAEVLKSGDMFSIHHGPLRIPMLYKVIDNAKSDRNGMTTVNISPRLRRNVADNDPISFGKFARSVFKLAAPFSTQRSSDTLPLGGRTEYEIIESPQIFDERNIAI